MARAYAPKRPPLDACPIEFVVALVGGKWKARLLYLLNARPFAFTALQAELPAISREVLTTQLRAMTRDGLITRAGTTYAITETGRSLVGVLIPAAEWAMPHLRARGETWEPPGVACAGADGPAAV